MTLSRDQKLLTAKTDADINMCVPLMPLLCRLPCARFVVWGCVAACPPFQSAKAESSAGHQVRSQHVHRAHVALFHAAHAPPGLIWGAALQAVYGVGVHGGVTSSRSVWALLVQPCWFLLCSAACPWAPVPVSSCRAAVATCCMWRTSWTQCAWAVRGVLSGHSWAVHGLPFAMLCLDSSTCS